jgi:hypothetical protein
MTGLFRKTAIAVAAGVVAALAVSGTAHAGIDTDVDGSYGAANFNDYGEKLSVDDYYADGWGTRAQLQVWHHPTSTWFDHGSPCFDDQSTGGADGVTVCDYEVAEGAQVRIHLWASRSGSTTDHRYSRVGVA